MARGGGGGGMGLTSLKVVICTRSNRILSQSVYKQRLIRCSGHTSVHDVSEFGGGGGDEVELTGETELLAASEA